MGESILSIRDRMPLGNGMSLRLLSGSELLLARREARLLAEEPGERPLCSNACLVARALETQEGEQLFLDGQQVLDSLTAEEIESLARRWDGFRACALSGAAQELETGVNPNFDGDKFRCREEERV